MLSHDPAEGNHFFWFFAWPGRPERASWRERTGVGVWRGRVALRFAGNWGISRLVQRGGREMGARDPSVTGYRVIVFAGAERGEMIRGIIGEATGAHPIDLAVGASRLPGVWPWPVSREAARFIVERLEAVGIAAEARRADDFPILGRPRALAAVAVLEEGLRCEGWRGEPTQYLPWSRVELVVAGWIARPDAVATDSSPTPAADRVIGWGRLFAGLRGRSAARDPVWLGGDGARLRRAARRPRDPLGQALVVRREPFLCLRLSEDRLRWRGDVETASGVGPAPPGDRAGEPPGRRRFRLGVATILERSVRGGADVSARSWRFARTPAPPEGFAPEFDSPEALEDRATLETLARWHDRRADSSPSIGE